MRTRPFCVLCLLLMGAIWAADLLGLSLFRASPLTKEMEDKLTGESVVVQGSLQQETENENSISIYLKNSFLIFKSKKIPLHNLRVYMESEVQLPWGTQVEVRGVLRLIEPPSNPGEFDSQLYCETQDIYYTLSQGEILRYSKGYSYYQEGIARLRERFGQCLQQVAGDHAGIFQAMVLGDKAQLDAQVKSQYQMAGIIHILAISGLHLSVLGTGLYKILKKLGAGHGLAGTLSLALILQYGVMTGESVATMRAVVMFLVGIGAKILGRCYDLLTSLSVAGILILIERPACLYYSGFLLSFGAVLGLGWILPVLERLPVKQKFLQSFWGAVSVHLVMAPLLLYFFSEVSLMGILLNLLVIPTVAVVLASGLAGVAAGFLWIGLGRILILPGRILLWIYGWLSALCCQIPFCTWVGGKPEFWQMALYYCGLILLVEAVRRAPWEQLRRPNLIRASLVGGYVFLLALLSWRDRQGLRITCLDVGQGDGIVWEKEGGECYLMDGGSTSRSQVGTYQILPYVKSRGISRIRAAFVTHTDEDHYNGIVQILEAQIAHTTSVRVESLVLPDWEHKSESYRHLERLAEEAKIGVSYLKRGDMLTSGELSLYLFKPEQENDLEDVNGGSMVAEMRYGKFRGLFTGDTGEEQERELLEELGAYTFLKVAHHGSKNSTCEEFLKRVAPRISVISVARTNRYRHPHPDTVERLRKWGGEIYMTKDQGAVTLWTDGEEVTVEGFLGEDQ